MTFLLFAGRSRHWMFLTIFVLLTLCGIADTAEYVNRKPNVLLITVDDLNSDLGAYGHPLVKSPHIDRLAAEGVRFDAAYVQYPVCAPSRASLMTGLYPEQIGVVGIGSNFRDNVPKVTTLPQLFKDNGYYSARVGKIYHYNVPSQIGTDGQDDAPSWHEGVNPIGIDKEVESAVQTINPEWQGDIGGTLTWLALDSKEEDHTDGKVTSEAIRLLRANHPGKSGRPFFLAVGYFRPHVPFIAPSKYFDLYDAEDIDPIETPPGDRDDIPVAALADRPKQLGLDEGQKREIIRAYYASISFVDAQVGRLLQELQRLELEDNTIVVFLSDHGFHLGHHGLWQKGDLFEGSVRAPLIVFVPGNPGNGQASASLTEYVDIYPTLADLAGLPAPEHLPGKSLRPVLADAGARVRDSSFSMARSTAWWTRPELKAIEVMGYTVRTSRYRYTEWADGHHGVELYDYQEDPDEYHNLAKVRDMASVRLRLERLLEERASAAKVRIPELEEGAKQLDELQ